MFASCGPVAVLLFYRDHHYCIILTKLSLLIMSAIYVTVEMVGVWMEHVWPLLVRRCYGPFISDSALSRSVCRSDLMTRRRALVFAYRLTIQSIYLMSGLRSPLNTACRRRHSSQFLTHVCVRSPEAVIVL